MLVLPKINIKINGDWHEAMIPFEIDEKDIPNNIKKYLVELEESKEELEDFAEMPTPKPTKRRGISKKQNKNEKEIVDDFIPELEDFDLLV